MRPDADLTTEQAARLVTNASLPLWAQLMSSLIPRQLSRADAVQILIAKRDARVAEDKLALRAYCSDIANKTEFEFNGVTFRKTAEGWRGDWDHISE